jgi:hypothetical protein
MHKHPHFKVENDQLLYLGIPIIKERMPLSKKTLIEYGSLIPFKRIIPNKRFNNKIVVVEPHPDDAVLSIGGHIINLLKEGNCVELLNVFSKSTVATLQYNNLLKLNDEIYTQIRLEESDFVVKQLLHSEFNSLNQEVALKRGHKSIFNSQPTSLDKKISELLIDILLEKVKDGANHLIFPMGVKGHIDHSVCYLTGLRMTQILDKNVKILFYEELPYSRNKFAFHKQLIELGKRLNISPIYSNIDSNIEQKVSMVLGYRSQNIQTNRNEIECEVKRDSRTVQEEARYLNQQSNGQYFERLWRVK